MGESLDLLTPEGEPSPTPPPRPTLTFDLEGDLHLFVGDGPAQQEMIVDSRALCRTSTVFRAMLKGPYIEGKPDQRQWKVTLPDDDPDAFAVLLDMTHGLYERTPAKPSINLLYDIAVTTNKYDMIRTLRPMAARWLKECYSELRSLPIDNLSQSLFIAWEFGERDLFQKLTESIAESMAFTPSQGKYTDDKAQEIELLEAIQSLGIMGKAPFYFQHRVPSTDLIQDTLKMHRDRKWEIIRTECHATIKALLTPSVAAVCESHLSTKAHPRADCQERVLGRLLQSAHANNISPVFSLQCRNPTGMSMAQLMEKLENVEKFIAGKASCNKIMHKTLLAIRVKSAVLPSLLSESQQKHLEAQAAKLALDVTSSGETTVTE